MAEKLTENATETPAPKKPAARKTAPRKKAEPKAAEPAASAKPAAAEKRAVVKKRELKPTDYVTVKNGFNGKLVYRSTKTGEKFVFDGFGAEHDMELQELRKAKNEHKKFFENNWFLIDDPDVIEYLGVREYYRNALSYEEFESIADMTADELAERMKLLSDGQKASVAHYARKLITDGRIDSMKAISVLEQGLGVQLIEH